MPNSERVATMSDDPESLKAKPEEISAAKALLRQAQHVLGQRMVSAPALLAEIADDMGRQCKQLTALAKQAVVVSSETRVLAQRSGDSACLRAAGSAHALVQQLEDLVLDTSAYIEYVKMRQNALT